MAVPNWMRRVRSAAAARNVSVDGMRPEPFRKWCWATQPVSKPSCSAVVNRSRAIRYESAASCPTCRCVRNPSRKRYEATRCNAVPRRLDTLPAAVTPTPTTDSAMYQTMHRQPDDLRRLLDTGWAPAEEAAQRLASARRVFTVGIGTSYHAALVGAWLLRAAGSDARAVSSFDFGLYPESVELGSDDAVVVMAHSGVKRYSNDSLARAAAVGATRISIGSLIAVHEGSQQVLRTVEREKSAAFTASHLAAMTVLAQVASVLGAGRRSAATQGFQRALEQLPDQVADALARESEILPIARDAASRRVYAVGAGPNEATALEAVIKVREAAQGWIDGLAIEQFLHGPLVAANADDIAVVVNVPGRAAERVGQIARVLDAIGARVWLIGGGVEGLARADVFALPAVTELLSPLLTVVPVQILAYQMAVVRGINPDLFRRDDPRYAEALGLVKL
jgi:glutamine---fructose-6-phosphate transaminase (isomerizing)